MKKLFFEIFLSALMLTLAFYGITIAATDISGAWTGDGTTEKNTCDKDSKGSTVLMDMTITQNGKNIKISHNGLTYKGSIRGKKFKATVKKKGKSSQGSYRMKGTIQGKINSDGTLSGTSSFKSYDIIKGKKKNACSEKWSFKKLAKQ